MEAVLKKNILNPELSLKKVAYIFFVKNTPDSVREFIWKIFQCWVTRECNIKAEISDEEVALFFDQLIDLVAAAYTLHQVDRASHTGQEGADHE